MRAARQPLSSNNFRTARNPKGPRHLLRLGLFVDDQHGDRKQQPEAAKMTCAQRETLTIAGFALDGSKWEGLYVGRRKGDDLVYAGKVDHGFDKTSTAELRRRLEPLVRNTQPYAKRIAHKGSGSSRSCRGDRVPG